MIKINLLNSVTERQGGTVMAVDRKVGSPASRLLLLTLAVAFLLAAVIGWDVISTEMAKADAERQLEEQKQIEKELEVVIKEQKELEEKIARSTSVSKPSKSFATNRQVRVRCSKRCANGSRWFPGSILKASSKRVNSWRSKVTHRTNRRSHSLDAASSFRTACSRT